MKDLKAKPLKTKPLKQKPASRKLKLPLFISFEGGEGAGKTSLINALSIHFDRLGYNLVITRQPGGSRLGEEIRELLLHPNYEAAVCAKSELFLFLAARAQNVQEVIIPSLREDKIILCDRFHDSTVAYQGFAHGLGEEDVEALSLYASDGIQPDLTIYLDVEPKLGLKRAKASTKDFSAAGKMDRIEAQKIEFHMRVREAFLRIAKKEPERFKILDAHLSRKQVFEQAVSLIEQFCSA